MKKVLLFLLICTNTITIAQIGINTSSPDPSYALDVNGDIIVDGILCLENPGNNAIIRNSELLIRSTSNEIIKYDIDVSKYGPINYAQFVFEELSTNGLQDYDTKIPVDEYLVSIQGYYFLEAGTGDTNIMTHSNISNDNIEGYQIYAYPNTTTNTWFVRAFINNGTFRTEISGSFMDTQIDLYLNLIAYRKGFITKAQSDINVNMGNSETITAPLPPGF